MRSSNLRLALLAAALMSLPIVSVSAASSHGPKFEWRTRKMNVDLAAERGACLDREFEAEAAGSATLTWAPDYRGREVAVTIIHRKSGQVVFSRTLCDAANFCFNIDSCLINQGKHFDVHIRQLGRRPCAVTGKLLVERLMRKD